MCECVCMRAWYFLLGDGKWPARLLGHDVVIGIWREKNNRVNIGLT